MSIDYRELDGAAPVAYYPDGNLSEIMIGKENLIVTAYGMFVPQYRPWDDGRRYESTARLHRDGRLKSFTLQHRAPVKTSLGVIECDAVSFHEDGSLNRVFPLNGKLSGYWTEANEYALAEEIVIRTGTLEFSARLISAAFYPSGKLRSVTLWPDERVMLDTPAGKIKIRTGVSFYEDGSIRSCEPAAPFPVSTPVGMVNAFDPDPTGVCGDVNSLEFTPDGKVKRIATVMEKVTVTEGDECREFIPGERRNLCFDAFTDPVPLRIAFDDTHVFLGSHDELFVYKQHDFKFELAAYRHERQVGTVKYACGQ